MRLLTRRFFLRWSAFVAALATGARRAAAMPGAAGRAPQGAVGLDAAALRPLAEAVLPAELGPAGVERAAGAFARWIGGYREGEERRHPYGSDRIGRTGPSPAARWVEQLAALDRDARSRRGAPFAQLAQAEREQVVRDALAQEEVTARVPAPVSAPHVALALLAHWLDSPEATNLCYRRRIDPRMCRPLRDSPREPLTNADARRRLGAGADPDDPPGAAMNFSRRERVVRGGPIATDGTRP